MTSSRWSAVIPLPEADMFPLGPCTTVDVAGERVICSVCRFPNPYVIVEGDPDRAEEHDSVYEHVREVVARAARLPIGPSSPKLAAVSAAPDGALRLRSRMYVHDGVGVWHRKIAQSALTALGATAITPHTVPHALLGRCTASQFDVLTPAGRRTVSTTVRSGRLHLVLAVGLVTLDAQRWA